MARWLILLTALLGACATRTLPVHYTGTIVSVQPALVSGYVVSPNASAGSAIVYPYTVYIQLDASSPAGNVVRVDVPDTWNPGAIGRKGDRVQFTVTRPVPPNGRVSANSLRSYSVSSGL